MPTKRSQKAIWNITPQERLRRLQGMEMDLEELPAPGLREIKQVELFCKWRPLLPDYARDITCPKASDEVMESVKACRKEKS